MTGSENMAEFRIHYTLCMNKYYYATQQVDDSVNYRSTWLYWELGLDFPKCAMGDSICMAQMQLWAEQPMCAFADDV